MSREKLRCSIYEEHEIQIAVISRGTEVSGFTGVSSVSGQL